VTCKSPAPPSLRSHRNQEPGGAQCADGLADERIAMLKKLWADHLQIGDDGGRRCTNMEASCLAARRYCIHNCAERMATGRFSIDCV
jgi:hypothetical protein